MCEIGVGLFGIQIHGDKDHGAHVDDSEADVAGLGGPVFPCLQEIEAFPGINSEELAFPGVGGKESNSFLCCRI